MSAVAERPRVEPTHADLIRVLVAAAPPLPPAESERVRALIKRATAPT